MDPSNIEQIIEYIWIPIVTGLVLLWRRFTGIDTRTQLLEQGNLHYEKIRTEEKGRRDMERQETNTRIDTHHKMVMSKLDSLETRIKNGH